VTANLDVASADDAPPTPSAEPALLTGRRRWAAVRRLSLAPDTLALLAIAAAVIVANLPALLGIVDINPLDLRSELGQILVPGLLGGRTTVDPSNGFTSQAIGHLAALDLLHLHLPWWNPYEGTGMPLAGETQAAALFPPTLLLALSNGQLYEHVLLELVAGICTYRLLRRVELTRWAALAAGVAFALNGKSAWFADAGVNPLAFLPMLLLGLERAHAAARARAHAAARARGRGGWRLIALATALSIYAGFPEVAYVDGLLAVVWFAWRCGCLGRREILRFVSRAALGVAAGILLAAPLLVAMVGYLGQADLVTHTGTGLGAVHLPLSEFPQLFMPYIFGPVNGAPHALIWIRVGGYLSALLLLFAGLGLASPGRRGLKLVLVGWGLLVFARIYGQPPLVGQILGVLPDMSKIQFYRYATAALELPVIVLAAVGLDDVTRGTPRRRRLALGALGAIAAVAGAAVVAGPVVDSLRPAVAHATEFRDASIAWAVLTCSLVGLIGLVSAARLRAGLLVLIVVLDAVALFAVPAFSGPRSVRVDLAPAAYLRRHLGEARFYTLGPIQPDYGSYFAIASLGLDDFPPQSYARYVHARLDPFAPFVGFRLASAPSVEQELVDHLPGYRAAAVRYVLTSAGQPLAPTAHAFRLVLRSPTTLIYRLTRSQPYFSAAGCSVSSPDRDTVRLTCARPTTLIRRETFLAGWSAQLDGRPVTIERHDGLFQAVRVPAGSHRLRFRFVPVGMNWGLLGLIAGCLLVLGPSGWGLVGRLRAGRPAAVAPAAR
jgi:hypothetical protein